MNSTAAYLDQQANRAWHHLLADVASLAKPRLSGLVVFTSAGAMWLSRAQLSTLTWICAVAGTAGTVAGANALNCYWERDSDRRMARTANRPLPAGRMEPRLALALGLTASTFSLGLLWWATNALTFALGLLALVSYVLVYTPLKPVTHWAMWAGAVPGALPPLMGWTAATGRIDAVGLTLFGILFFWQLPHFIAIALFRKSEYAAAGLKNLPEAVGDSQARWQAVAYLFILWGLSLVPFALGIAGVAYASTAVVLGGWFFGKGLLGAWAQSDAAWARRLFFASLVHLTGLFVALGLDSNRLS